jgi:hypothetical protein
MAVITRVKCDRCGFETTENSKTPVYTGVVVHISSPPTKDAIEMESDLCADCFNDLMSRTKSFLNIPEETEETP